MNFWKPTDVTIRYKITKLLEIPPYDSIKKIHVMRFGKTNLLYDQIKKNKDDEILTNMSLWIGWKISANTNVLNNAGILLFPT